MEGFLQSLKFKSEDMQKNVCTMIGKKAKFKGKKKNWWKRQTLYWKGKEIDRASKEYEELICRAFDALHSYSESFRRALDASRGSTLTHSVGKNNPKRTILTNTEFVRNLNRLRG